MNINYADAAAVVKGCKDMQDFWNIHPEWYRLADDSGWLPSLYPGQPPLFPRPVPPEQGAMRRLSVATQCEVKNFIKLPTERNYCYVVGYLTALESNGILSYDDYSELLRFVGTVKKVTLP